MARLLHTHALFRWTGENKTYTTYMTGSKDECEIYAKYMPSSIVEPIDETNITHKLAIRTKTSEIIELFGLPTHLEKVRGFLAHNLQAIEGVKGVGVVIVGIEEKDLQELGQLIEENWGKYYEKK